jgi:hypothetical protein
VPFRYDNRTYILFGDTHGGIDGDWDAIPWTTEPNPSDGLQLHFLHDNNGVWKPVTIPGIEQAGFDVPMEGVEVDNKMYIYNTTDHTLQKTMGRSVVARSDNGEADFKLLYTFSKTHYINVSIVKTSLQM